ncbi:MAG: hypothetical protein FWD54_05400 [Endomicrobia bacterium]|nr:hypothetical protein [Endomicrobiia bacterium]
MIKNKNRFFVLAFCLLFLSIFPVSKLCAATHDVSNSGFDQSVFQSSINTIYADGDVVVFDPGTYKIIFLDFNIN